MESKMENKLKEHACEFKNESDCEEELNEEAQSIDDYDGEYDEW